MSRGSARFLERAAAAGLRVEPHEFPDGTRTAQQAAEAVGCSLGQIVKSLVFMVDDRPVLALVSGANRVATGRLGAAFDGARVRTANADEVRLVTGYAIGGTPPLGHDRPLPTVLDRDLLGFDTVWAAAGTPTEVFAVTPDDLCALTGARVLDLAEA